MLMNVQLVLTDVHQMQSVTTYRAVLLVNAKLDSKEMGTNVMTGMNVNQDHINVTKKLNVSTISVDMIAIVKKDLLEMVNSVSI